MQKSSLRAQILGKRRTVHTLTVRGAMLGHLRDFLSTHTNASIGLFWPIRGEVDFLFELMQSVPASVTLSLPSVEDGLMQYRCYWQSVSVDKDETGVMAPRGTAIVEPEFVFVPCVAMDKAGFRLGYGKGWFDRYMVSHPKVKAIGVVASDFLLEELPHEAHDQKLQGYLTEKGIQWICSQK